MWRRIEAMRDRIMDGVGTTEPWVIEMGQYWAVHYRRPLRLDEVNQLPADNPFVRAREGRG